jgi:hypothetical protein
MTDTIEPGHPRYPVAPEVMNSLRPPVIRLPIGGSARYPAMVLGGASIFVLRVPTNAGGTLTLEADVAASVALQQPFGKNQAKGWKKIVHEVPKGQFGDFFFLVLGAAATASCTFVQIGAARDGTGDADPPLVPWHFWYWPTAEIIDTPIPGTNKYGDQAVQILDRYAKAMGIPGPEQAGKWENQRPPDGHRPYLAPEWEGHCHMMAPASVLFEQPAPSGSKKIGGETFTQDELELLAGEWFGNFGQMNRRWYPKEYVMTKVLLLACFKPAEKKDKDTLRVALDRFYPPGPKHKPSVMHAMIPAFVEKTYNELGGDDQSFEAAIQGRFGTAAAEFYGCLVKELRENKHALISDMRSYSGQGGPEEVWNQAFFYYRAVFKEVGQDDRSMQIKCILYSNVDVEPPSTGGPGQVQGSEVTPIEPTPAYPKASLRFENLWSIRFDDAGNIASSHAFNRWKSVTNPNGEELYAPMNLTVLLPPTPDRHASADGNPLVKWDLVDRGLVTIRKRYR